MKIRNSSDGFSGERSGDEQPQDPRLLVLGQAMYVLVHERKLLRRIKNEQQPPLIG